MPATVTDSEVRSNSGPPGSAPERPAASTRARENNGHGAWFQLRIRIRVLGRLFGLIARRSWIWTARPASLGAAWRLSAIDRSRIARASDAAEILWLISNWTDRLLLFALILVMPTGLQGPLRWIVQRPSRRVGLYVVCGLLWAVFTVGG